ncbi:MAG: hypothetical protein JETT_0119 [Candidatus Jettenia ecosi]|uniref:Uncharacterized protein n=1 Tax=Candidatus Jettenia ecosi TaxID=2494326 RepID=A0A533QFC9_9BACT|nr:MAG: hypothetical protein JETT_0119 [Candidatus Jettenia ecosi]
MRMGIRGEHGHTLLFFQGDIPPYSMIKKLDIWAFCKAKALPCISICKVVGNMFCIVVNFSTLLLTCLLYHFNTKYVRISS